TSWPGATVSSVPSTPLSSMWLSSVAPTVLGSGGAAACATPENPRQAAAITASTGNREQLHSRSPAADIRDTPWLHSFIARVGAAAPEHDAVWGSGMRRRPPGRSFPKHNAPRRAGQG